MRTLPILQSVLFELAIQSGSADSEHGGGNRAVALRVLERLNDGALLYFGKRQDAGCAAFKAARSRSVPGMRAHAVPGDRVLARSIDQRRREVSHSEPGT